MRKTKKATAKPVTVTVPAELWKKIKAEAKRREERMFDFVPAVLATGLARLTRGKKGGAK